MQWQGSGSGEDVRHDGGPSVSAQWTLRCDDDFLEVGPADHDEAPAQKDILHPTSVKSRCPPNCAPEQARVQSPRESVHVKEQKRLRAAL